MYGLYALPSLVDQNVVTITNSLVGPLLLEGPGSPDVPKPYQPIPGHNYELPPGTSPTKPFNDFFKKQSSGIYTIDPVVFQSMPAFKGKFVIFTGHYDVPDYANMQFFIDGRTETKWNLITDASEPKKPPEVNSVGVQTEDDREMKLDVKIETYADSVKYAYNSFKMFINMQENKGLKLTLIVLVGCIIAMFWYLQMQVERHLG